MVKTIEEVIEECQRRLNLATVCSPLFFGYSYEWGLLSSLLPVIAEMHICPLPLIFSCLAVYRVVHKLVEICLHIVLCRGTHGGIH